MPGSNARAIEKAKSLAADVLLLDLEDAVAPDLKATARSEVANAVRAAGFGPRELVIRLNGLSTPWFADDVKSAALAMPDAILLPKAETPADLGAAAAHIRAANPARPIALWAMIETPRGILNVAEIARVAASQPEIGLSVLVLGTNDLVKETRAELDADRTAALYWLSATVTAGRAYGLDVLDGVFNAFKDAEGFARECHQGRRLGMTGKTLIHPDQIATANTVFQPSAAEVASARRIIEAFDLPENAGKGAITLDGRMVELLHVESARKTLRLADAIAARA
jgi:citrate lyase subunit beta/citryl-CoA lyase